MIFNRSDALLKPSSNELPSAVKSLSSTGKSSVLPGKSNFTRLSGSDMMRQRERVVGSKTDGLAVERIMIQSSGGSSSVFNSAFCASDFSRSASFINPILHPS